MFHLDGQDGKTSTRRVHPMKGIHIMLLEQRGHKMH